MPRDKSGSTPQDVKRDAEAARDLALTVLIDGVSDMAACQRLRDEFGCSAQQAKRVLDRVYSELCTAQRQRTPEDVRARALEQRERLVARALDKDDIRAALAVMDSRDKLLNVAGVDAPGAAEQVATLLEIAELARGARNLTDADGDEDSASA